MIDDYHKSYVDAIFRDDWKTSSSTIERVPHNILQSQANIDKMHFGKR